jgi:hypothetical protein
VWTFIHIKGTELHSHIERIISDNEYESNIKFEEGKEYTYQKERKERAYIPKIIKYNKINEKNYNYNLNK